MASVRLKHAISVIRPFLADNLRGKSRYVKRLGLDHYKTCLCECTCVLHTSVSTWKGKQFKVKYVEPKKKAPTVKVWTNMTAEELAAATQRDIDVIWDALELTKDREGLRNARSVLQNVTMVCSACKLLGYRGVIGAPPNLCITEEQEDKDVRKRPPPDPKDLVKRPPVVTIMGHVDHGKTTLLDTLRHTSVVQNEFGGITQHIGAFTVNVNQKEKVTFLDTPGHAAFSAMRARGAYVTDIVVLVVAADDGVMEQTVESIRYARDANVSIIVAVNKMDKPNLDIEHVKSELIAQDLQIEDIGGDVQLVYISAKTGLNVEQLIEAILVQAEVMEIKGDPKGLVEGAILESSTDTARGKLATVLVQRGTLKKGDYLVSGTAWAKVRILIDEWGKPVQLAPPGTPVQVLGWKELPSAGEEILQVKTEVSSIFCCEDAVLKQQQRPTVLDSNKDYISVFR